MFHIENKRVKELLLTGNFGLEKESLRIYTNGRMSHSRHPFPNENNIIRDFCENQTEINTTIYPTANEAIQALQEYTNHMQNVLVNLEPKELLWPFSSPPYIKNEEDIPIAIFTEDEEYKTKYREYLSNRYGRYKMTFSGIHINYSFSDKLLIADYSCSSFKTFMEYKNSLYLNLAKKAAKYGWIVTILTAASPLLDASFVEKGAIGETTFNGMASSRCSELGYWNHFTPVLDYESVDQYVKSIQKYVDDDLLASPSEFYYPIRLKPRGVNDLEKLRKTGINHIELRMVDLNPLEESGLNEKDLKFVQLLLVYLASTPDEVISTQDQVYAVQNFKSAAHYDLKTVKILDTQREICSVIDAGDYLLTSMKEFYKEYPQEIIDVLNYQHDKIINPDKRYAWIIRKMFGDKFNEKGLKYAIEKQEKIVTCVKSLE